MTDVDKLGIQASTTIAQLINHVVTHPGQAVTMRLLRDAVQAQANYTIGYAIEHLEELCAKVDAIREAQQPDDSQPDPPPKPA